MRCVFGHLWRRFHHAYLLAWMRADAGGFSSRSAQRKLHLVIHVVVASPYKLWNSLLALLAATREAFALEAEALGRFELMLAQTGYSPVNDADYAQMNLRVVEECLFAVRDTFPRLILDRIAGGVPAGVERVEYEINLAGCESLVVNRTDPWASRTASVPSEHPADHRRGSMTGV